MNTKGIKFLAVLAVMVMAFAAIVALAPADNDMDAVDIGGFEPAQIDPAVIDVNTTSLKQYEEYYVSDDLTIKVKSLAKNIKIYVQNGKELELNIKKDLSPYTITVYSVTGDLQRHVTSTVYSGDDSLEDNPGKIVIRNTEFTFTGVKGQTVTYKALMPSVTTTYKNTTSMQTEVYTYDFFADEQLYAVISSDMPLGAPTIGEYVTIAPGQYIEVEDNTRVATTAYGVLIYDKDSTDAKFTFYAVGADAGSVSLANGDYVEVLNGSANVKNGSVATVKASSVVSEDGALISWADGEIDVSGEQYSGTLTVSGKIMFDDDYYIDDDAIVIVNNNTSIVSGSEVTVEGTLILKNDAKGIENLCVNGTGVIVAQNIKLWSYNGVDPYLGFDEESEFYGLYDVDAITETAYVENRFATAYIAENQTFIVISDTTVTTSLEVRGVLIINEGVTLTITKTQDIGAAVTLKGQYAQIINNGEIVIKTTKAKTPTAAPVSGLQIAGGYGENNGKITASSDNKVKAPTLSINIAKDETNPGSGFINYGTITTSKSDIVAFTAGFVNAGNVTINGNIADAATAFTNSGSVTLNGTKILDEMAITTIGFGTVNVVSVQLASEATIAVSGEDALSSIVVAAPELEDEYLTVRGLTITDASTIFGEVLDVSGSVGLIRSSGVAESVKATITMDGGIMVSGAASISDGFKLEFSTDGVELKVPGTFTLAKGVVYGTAQTQTVAATSSTAENLEMIVTGTVTTLEGDQLNGCKYAAAKYTLTNGTTIYTNLAAAIAGADEADVTMVDVGYIPGATPAYDIYVTMTSDVAIPEGLTVDGDFLVVDDGATLFVESTGRLSITNVIVKEGAVLAENSNDVNIDDIYADVETVDPESSAVACMSLDVALALAQPGAVITLAQDFVMTSDELVIPAGVTVDATAGDEPTAFVMIDSNLVVNGLLVVNDFIFVATTDDTKGIILNDTIMDQHQDGDCFDDKWYTPVGVSYQLTIPDEYGNEVTWFVITNIANIQEAIDIADDAKVTVEGNPKLGDLTLVGDEDQPAEVTFNGDINAGTITISNVTIVGKDGNQVNATIKDALGSITIIGAYVDSELAIYSLEDAGVYMAGAVTDDASGTYTIMFNGITGIDGTTKSRIGWGYYADGTPTVLFAGVTTATGKKVVISEMEEEKVSGMVTITGSFIADNATKVIMNSDVQVLGGLYAAERTEDAVAGSVEINGDLFVGALKSDLYDVDLAIAAVADDAQEKYVGKDQGYGHTVKPYTAATAAVSGKIEVAADRFITVLNGSLIDATIIEDLDYMDVVIEDAVWITVYGTAKYSMDGLLAPIVNAKVDSILDADGNKVAKFSHAYKVVYGCPEKKLSEYGNEVVFILDYNAFKVTIKTDGSVKAVYIDGILMYTGQNENVFELDKVAAGTHKVTVEAATGYDADKCVLYTDMGTILPGMAFTFTEYDCVVEEGINTYNVIYNINGTEIQPEPVPPTPEEESQWTITTILLVILVVLIAIMAVIVALRLNRS